MENWNGTEHNNNHSDTQTFWTNTNNNKIVYRQPRKWNKGCKTKAERFKWENIFIAYGFGWNFDVLFSFSWIIFIRYHSMPPWCGKKVSVIDYEFRLALFVIEFVFGSYKSNVSSWVLTSWSTSWAAIAFSTFFFDVSCISPPINSSSNMKYAFSKLKMMSSSQTCPNSKQIM